MELQNSFDNGTDGVEITVANSATSGDAFSIEDLQAAFYDAEAFAGPLGAALLPFPDSGTVGWRLVGQSAANVYLRVLAWIPAASDGWSSLCIVSVTAEIAYIGMEAGVLNLITTNDGTVPFAAVPPRDAWFRVELGINAGQVEARYFVDPTASVPTEIEQGTWTGPVFNDVLWQNDSSDALLHLDQVGFRDTDWWGPLSAPVVTLGGNRMGEIGAIRKPPR
ncbi:MAG: hypothetical protein M3537_09320 [Chloroflexota bacterium]|nr:hypothetical protein [Chloroflexota bacterium]